MVNYFIADRKVTTLTMVVTVGGNPTVQQTRVSHRPFYAFNMIPFSDLTFARVSDKKMDGIVRRQTAPKKRKWTADPYLKWPFQMDKTRSKNPQAFCAKSTQFILRNIGPEISYSTAKEVLGQPIRKGKLLIWPKASFEQEVVMAAIDQCHDRSNGNIYNGVITIGHQTINIKDYLRKAE